MTLDEFASRLQKAKPKSFKDGPGYTACCPAHEDSSPSFRVCEKDGWLHVKCLTGCTEDQILSSLGLTGEDRRIVPFVPQQLSSNGHSNGSANSNPSYKKFICSYTYTDEKGAYLFDKMRYVDGTGKKTFLQKDKNKEDGKFGVDHLGVKAKVLYRLHKVLDAKARGTEIWLHEGEKACDRMEKEGYVSTCQPGGATKESINKKWLPSHTKVLAGCNVVMVMDPDEVGLAYAEYVAEQVRPVAKSFRLVQSATKGEKDDAFDHFEAGFTVDQFIDRSDLLPSRGFELTKVEDYDIKDPEFLIGTHIRLGQINLLDADGGVGKSSTVLAIAACGSNGYDPIRKQRIEPFRTLYFGGEDEGSDIRYIYEKMGGRPGFLEVKSDVFPIDEHHLALLEETIHDGGFKLVVFDSIAYYLGGLVEDLNNAVALAKPLGGLRNVAIKTMVAILNLRHVGKGKDGKAISDLGIGSVQIRNAHRSQLVMRYHPDEDNFPGVRVLTHEKGSIRVARGPMFAWKYENDEFLWVYGIDEATLNYVPKKISENPAHTIERRVMVERWMLANLSGKYVVLKDMIDQLKSMGVSMKMIEQARSKLKVQALMRGDERYAYIDPFSDGVEEAARALEDE